MNWSGRTYVVTGGTKGIGRATAELLRSLGADVAILGRSASSGAEVERGCGAVAFIADVGSEADVAGAFAGIETRFGGIDGLVTSAGIAVLEGMIHEEPVDTWDRVIRTNLRGTFLAVREAAIRLVAQGRGGSIVCASSVVAGLAIPGGTNAYTASKGAICALVRQLAVDYGQFGIRVNAVMPGATETDLMWNTTPPDEVEAVRTAIGAVLPLRRLARPTDIAHAIVWLLSDSAAFVTGSEVTVDGGGSAKSVLPV